ncbi:DUF1127 domain-containing protein [Yoonia sp. MH D7]
MATNIQTRITGDKNTVGVPEWIVASAKFLQRTGSSFMRGLSRYIYAVQVSQTQRALSRMSDAQLTTIGIKRYAIPRHAASLIVDDAQVNA